MRRLRIRSSFILIVPVLLAAFFTPGSPAGAASQSTGPISISADIPGALALNVTILNVSTGAALETMDFGALSSSGSTLASSQIFRVLLEVNSQGAPFEILQEASPLTRNGGTEEIPVGAFSSKPLYVESENGGAPAPAAARIAGPGPAQNVRTVFVDPTGMSRSVSLVYDLSGDPANGATEAIPAGQRSGSYSGNIQYTLVTS